MGARTTVRHRLNKGTIQPMKVTGLAVAAIAAAISLSAPAYADPDTDFDNQLGRFGIYGPHDYNPYIAKIVCHRLGVGVDPDMPCRHEADHRHRRKYRDRERCRVTMAGLHQSDQERNRSRI